MYVVMRPFREGELDLKPGEMVEAERWPNTPLLVAQRYLRELPEETAARTPKAAERDRRSS